MRQNLCTLFLSFLVGSSAWANYAWIPKYQHLELKIGGEFLRTSENFNSVGTRDDIAYVPRPGATPQLVSYKDFSFVAEAEYGVVDEVSVGLRLPFQTASLDAQDSSSQSLLKSSGLGDVNVGIKWNFRKTGPTLTAETYLKIPSESVNSLQADDLLRGDANYDLGFLLNAGHIYQNLFFDITPGVIFRFNGYSSGFTAKTMVGVRFKPGYFYLFSTFYSSFTDELLYDTAAAGHTVVAQAGGSYHSLSGSPSFWEAGARGGVRLSGPYFLEAFLSQSLWGRRAANSFVFGFNLVGDIDFSKKDTRTRVRDVPFDAPNDTTYKTEEKKEPEKK